MIAAGLARYSDDDPNRLTFKHALIRDAAYNTLLRTARRTYHRRIADGYAASERRTSPDVLAFHLHEAGDFAGAAPHWVAAAQADLGSSSLFEAARHLALAIDCVHALEPTVEVRTLELELQSQIWPLWAATEGWGSSNVEAACQRGLELASGLERYDLLYVPLWGLWTVYFLRGEMGRALDTARQVHAMAEATGVPMLRLTGEHALGYTHLYRGELDEALAAAERGLAFYDFDQERVIANTFQLASTLALLAIQADVQYLKGAVATAEAGWERLDRLARDLDHPPSLAAGLAFLLHGGALRFATRGRTDRLQPIVDELVAVTEDEGSLLWNAVANCFRVAGADTDDAEADQRMELAWELFSQTGSGLTEVLTRVVFAETRLCRNDVDGAERDLALAERAFLERGEALLAPEIWRLRARIAAASNRLSQAHAAIEKSLELADRQGAPMLRLRTLLESLDFIDDGQRENVLGAIAGTIAHFDADDEPDVARALLLLNEQPHRKPV
jgi:tetratricopeptide (TPR) repeat protein